MSNTNKQSVSTMTKIAIGVSVGFVSGYVVSKLLASAPKEDHNGLKCGQYKRIITGHDKNGKAIVIQRDLIPNRKNPANRRRS